MTNKSMKRCSALLITITYIFLAKIIVPIFTTVKAKYSLNVHQYVKVRYIRFKNCTVAAGIRFKLYLLIHKTIYGA